MQGQARRDPNQLFFKQVPTDGLGLPVVKSGDLGTSPFCGQLAAW